MFVANAFGVFIEYRITIVVIIYVTPACTSAAHEYGRYAMRVVVVVNRQQINNRNVRRGKVIPPIETRVTSARVRNVSCVRANRFRRDFRSSISSG